MRRSITKPTELTFYVTHAPKSTSLATLARIAGLRWPIESLFEQSKGEVGLDQYEVRSWVGWHRHIKLAMFAFAYRAVIRKNAIAGVDPMNLAEELLPLTVPEVRRLLWRWSAKGPHRRALSCTGPHGDASISNALGAPIGADEDSAHSAKPGCSSNLTRVLNMMTAAGLVERSTLGKAAMFALSRAGQATQGALAVTR